MAIDGDGKMLQQNCEWLYIIVITFSTSMAVVGDSQNHTAPGCWCLQKYGSELVQTGGDCLMNAIQLVGEVLILSAGI